MHLLIDPQPSCARAWVAAASAVIDAGDEAFNVIIGVDDPTRYDGRDNDVINSVDRFLKNYKHAPIATVANTIFPEALYREFGPTEFYAEYLRVFDRLTSKRWGRYFERMIQRPDPKQTGETYNPLKTLIGKLQRQTGARAAYELALYNPDIDRNQFRNMPCLSHLSFKRHPDRTLSLTALYRNHTYISRCLGNLIGLGRLQAFVAAQSGLKVGPLTCISTHAEVDKGDDKDRAKNWGITRARALVRQASGLLNAPAERPAPV